ncbi:MAG: hypothetical protein OXF01_10495 [Gemmatimonadetes bacterium]|nr:hypothetical protein [Gemmatimonadota bacterium]
MTGLAPIATPSPTSSAETGENWNAIAGSLSIEPELSGRVSESWVAGFDDRAGGNTEDASPVVKPWYADRGMDGMRPAVDRMKALARTCVSCVQFSIPEVERVSDDEGEELIFVVVDIYIPAKVDGAAFRDQFFGQLAENLADEDLARLAIGVGHLGLTL